LNDYILNEMKIEVTYNCLLSCIHCSSNANPKNKLEMTKEKCIEIIDDAVSMGLKKIIFSGGEPFLWEGLIDVVTHSKEQGLNCSIYTSGNCVELKEILIKLKLVGIDKLIFSLFSDIENEHDRVTRKLNSFNNTIRAINLAQSLQIQTEIHFVILASNYKKLTGIIDIAKKYKIKRISALRFVPQGRGALIKKFDSLNKKQYLELRKIILDLQLNNKEIEIRTGSPFNVLLLNNEPECLAAQDRLVVAPDLNIYPCDAFKQISSESISPDDKYSNLKKYSLVECWKKSNYFNIIRNTIIGKPSEPCQSCKKHSKCLSGCLAQKYLFYSSLNKNPDPACLIGA